MIDRFRLLLAIISVGCFLVAPSTAQQSPGARLTVHVVQRGENLFGIALQYDLAAEALAAANGLADNDSLAVGQRLIVPLASAPSQPPATHVIAAGETLLSIAAAYDTTVASLLTLNDLALTDVIYAGQRLTIAPGGFAPLAEPTPADASPAPATARGPSLPHSFSRAGDRADVFVHIVKSGETLSAIGLRYNQSVNALAQANHMADPSILGVGQRLTVPGIQLPRLTQALPDLVAAFTIDPLVFEGGRSGRVELLTREPVVISGRFLDSELRVISREGGKRHNILVGVPLFTEKNVYPLTLELRDGSGAVANAAAELQVITGGYGRQTLTIDDSELLAPEVEAEEIALLARLASPFTAERAWTSALSLPAAAPINATFGTLRSYNGGPFDRYHGGVDFAGAPGTSVLAAADGVVVMADRLNIRGNTTLIDHGWGLYTLYAHQDEILAQLGERVATGQVIGTVGSTGRSTGPHLHWEAWLNGVNIDPMQWVNEAFP